MSLAGARVTIVSASEQNAFFEDLEQSIAYALRLLGADVHHAVDRFPDPAADDAFVMIPHEFLALTHPIGHPDETALSRTIAIATEQPGTHWFELSREFCSRCAATLDISRVGASALRATGVRVQHLPLTYCPEWDVWHGEAASERPRDVLFLGTFTPRREQAIARCAPVLSSRNADVLLADGSRPLRPGMPGVVLGREAQRLYAGSKTLLNVHRSEQAYFEWHRILAAVINGCVVVSEHSLDPVPLVPGVDFVSSTIESLPYLLDLVLTDREILQELQQSAIRRVRSELPPEMMAEVLAEAVTAVLSRPLPPRRRAQVDAATAVAAPPPFPDPGWAFLSRPQSDLQVIRLGLKRLLRGAQEIRRSFEQLGPAAVARDARVTYHGPHASVNPEISVVLTVHDYETLVREAIVSVGRSRHSAFELVVVDDASTDGSVLAVEQALQACPWLPATLVRQPSNGGLSAARNAGVHHSRGELVFILDADNVIYPRALDELARPLREDLTLSFAYGVIERFDQRGPLGLLSWPAWDPYRLRYGNYIDAMAMIRRSDLIEAGGYTSDPRFLLGWEDFELWCRFADRGMRGVRVPNVLARYRTGRLSMLAVTNIDTSDEWSSLLDRYPFLSSDNYAFD